VVVDTSVLVAILGLEPEAPRLVDAFVADGRRLISAASLLEAAIVVEARFGEAGGRELDLLVTKSGLEIEAVTADQVEYARDAWRRFGKGRHAAGLNYGGCFSYALAKASGEPLLFKGKDFALTDIAAVEY